MSVHFTNKNINNSIGKTDNIYSTININQENNVQNNKDNNKIKSMNKSKSINNLKIIYPYPICLHNEKDPLDDFKLRAIKARNKGADTFLKNYLKFDFEKNNIFKQNKNKALYQGIKNNKNYFFLTEDKKVQISKSLNNINPNEKEENFLNYKKTFNKSNSSLFNFSKKSINQMRNVYIKEMERRGNQYNKIKMASLQRIALHNFSSINLNDNHYVNGSIPSGKSDESYILETQKRRKLPGIREYLCHRLKNMKENEVNTPEYYREKNKKNEVNKLPEIIDIKNSGRFRFHVFHDQYGFRKQLDKRPINKGLKMTKNKIRDLKVMANISKIKDPELIDLYKRALYDDYMDKIN